MSSPRSKDPSEGKVSDSAAPEDATTPVQKPASAAPPSPSGSPKSKRSATSSVATDEDREPLSAVNPTPTAPTTLVEMNLQLESILYSLRILEHLQARKKYISQREVTNLRKAFEFTVSEVARHVAQKQPSATASPTNSCSELPHPDGEGAEGTAVPHDAARFPQAEEAERLLRSLEEYVRLTPTSSTYQTTATGWSWRSVFHTPSERRLQSVMIFTFMFFTFIPISLCVSGLLLYCKYTCPFMLLYIISIFTFDKTKHPIKKDVGVCQHWIWKYYRDYFPCRLVVREEVRHKFDKQRNYLFGYHPHGVHTFGAIMNFGLDTNGFQQYICPGITTHVQTLGVNFYVPFWRRLMAWMGCGDASASTIRKTLRSGPGESVVLVVGGAEESLMSRPNTNDLYLINRKGFIKIALQEGSPLVPCYGFGENNLWRVPSFAANPHVKRVMRLIKQVTGFVPILIVGRGFFNFRFGVMPLRTPIVVVVGEPLEVPKIPQPTAEDLEYWQQQYITALERLYEENRGIYDLESTGLRIMN